MKHFPPEYGTVDLAAGELQDLVGQVANRFGVADPVARMGTEAMFERDHDLIRSAVAACRVRLEETPCGKCRRVSAVVEVPIRSALEASRDPQTAEAVRALSAGSALNLVNIERAALRLVRDPVSGGLLYLGTSGVRWSLNAADLLGELAGKF
jgi:hypothetical protein